MQIRCDFAREDDPRSWEQTIGTEPLIQLRDNTYKILRRINLELERRALEELAETTDIQGPFDLSGLEIGEWEI